MPDAPPPPTPDAPPPEGGRTRKSPRKGSPRRASPGKAEAECAQTSEAAGRGELLLGYERSPRVRPLGFHTPIADGERTERATPLVAPPEGHLLTVAPTRSGKGVAALIPTLLDDTPRTTIAFDPKGELASITARHRRTLGPVALVDPFHLTTERPDRLNPFDLARLFPGRVEEVAILLAELLLLDHQNPHTSSDPFWDNRSRALLAGLIAAILTGPDEGARHPGELRRRLSADDVDYALAVWLDTNKGGNALAYKELAQYLQLPAERTRPSVLGTAQQHVRLLGDPAVGASMESTSFDLGAVFRGEPITVYLVLPASKLRSHALVARLWLAALLYAILERRAKPEVPTLLLLDEAAQLGRMELLLTAITLMAGYGVRAWTFWQSLAQIRTTYGAAYSTVLDNASVVQTFGAGHHHAAAELARVLGGTAEELLGLGADEQLVAMAGQPARRARKLNYLRDPRYRGRYDPNPLHEPEPQRGDGEPER